MLVAGLIATAMAGREGRYLPLILTVFLYMVFMPVSVGLMLPVNLFLLDVTGLSLVDVSIGEAISSWIWGTPFFVLTYAMTGMKQAFWAGAGAVAIGSVIFQFLGPNSQNFNVNKTLAVTSIAGLFIVGIIMFGPLGIFEMLFKQFRAI
jgi:F0F1-type ATP synthase membrane subunit a